MAFTKGFGSTGELFDHYDRHAPNLKKVLGPNVPMDSEDDYQARADEFCGGPVDKSLPYQDECIRPNGERIRYNDLTKEWGVITGDGVIKTYYILTKALKKYRNGFTYLKSECKKS